MTSNLERKLREHRLGKTKSTKNRTIKSVQILEECKDRLTARNREKYWKSGIGREKIKRQRLE